MAAKFPKDLGFVEITDSKQAIYMFSKIDMAMWMFRGHRGLLRLYNISNLHKSNMAAQIPQNVFFDRQTAKINIYFDSWLFIRWDLYIISLPILILSSEVYLGPRNNVINFGHDPDYDPDPGSRCDLYYTAEVCSL